MVLKVLPGDMREVLAEMPDNSVDSVVTDPPYHLTSIVKRFGAGNAPAQFGSDGAFQRASKGFMGKEWDGGDIAFNPATWAEVLRVLKPGGHMTAFNHSRTFHRMWCAVEDAGFEIRDTLMWIYGSGFPKSHDVAKGIAALAARGSSRPEDIRREAMGENYAPSGRGRVNYDHGCGSAMSGATAEPAGDWAGWGTALKPAFEPIVLARKPLAESSVARQVLATGTGAVNIGACRVGDEKRVAAYTSLAPCHGNALGAAGTQEARRGTQSEPKEYVGRWPANVLHGGLEGDWARYFYCAKAGKADRRGSDHPTVKPQALMRWLVRLVTPPGGLVLDPFAGSGSTGWAADAEGFDCTMIEQDLDYIVHLFSQPELSAA